MEAKFKVGDGVKCENRERYPTTYPMTFKILKITSDNDGTKLYHLGLVGKVYLEVKEEEMQLIFPRDLTGDEMLEELGWVKELDICTKRDDRYSLNGNFHWSLMIFKDTKRFISNVQLNLAELNAIAKKLGEL